MPRASGFFVLTAIDAIRPEIPVVVISGNAHHSRRALDYGARAFMAKPFSLANMARVMHDLLPASSQIVASA